MLKLKVTKSPFRRGISYSLAFAVGCIPYSHNAQHRRQTKLQSDVYRSMQTERKHYHAHWYRQLSGTWPLGHVSPGPPLDFQLFNFSGHFIGMDFMWLPPQNARKIIQACSYVTVYCMNFIYCCVLPGN